MDPETFGVITARLRKYGTRVLSLTGGEPALHPQLERIFQIAEAANFRSVNLLTNLYYSDALQDKVIGLAIKYHVGIHTSYDGFAEVADKLRGASKVQRTVERAMLMINELRKSGAYQKKPTATVVVSALNIDQLPRIIARLEELDWNINIDLYRWGSANHREEDILKIKDKDQILNAIALIRKAKNLKTPLWYFDGLEKLQHGAMNKQCPYLISPTFGSKFFIHEKGDIHTCMPNAIGNLITSDIEDIFRAGDWKAQQEDFQSCQGCWNTCYTVSSRALSYLHLGTIRQYLGKG